MGGQLHSTRCEAVGVSEPTEYHFGFISTCDNHCRSVQVAHSPCTLSCGARAWLPPQERHQLPATLPRPRYEANKSTRLDDKFFSIITRLSRSISRIRYTYMNHLHTCVPAYHKPLMRVSHRHRRVQSPIFVIHCSTDTFPDN